MNKQEILRQLQSRIDKRSNEITEVEDFYKNDFGIMVTLADHEKDYLDELRWEQTLDKRCYGLIVNIPNFGIKMIQD